MISLPYRLLILGLIIAAVGGLGFMKGWSAQGARFEKYKVDTALATKTRMIERQKIVNKVIVEVQTVREVVEKQGVQNEERIREAAAAGDLDGELSGHFRLLYNDAVTGLGFERADAATAPPVPVETVARALQANFTTCRKNEIDHNGLIDAIERIQRKEK